LREISQSSGKTEPTSAKRDPGGLSALVMNLNHAGGSQAFQSPRLPVLVDAKVGQKALGKVTARFPVRTV
jgi:hypothetical protein